MTAIFDRIASRYDKNRGGEARGQRFADVLFPLINRDHKILEMGVGTGLVAGALQKMGCTVVGIDLSEQMLQRAIDRVQLLILADMNNLPFMNGYFGSVYSVWSLHMVEDMLASLKEINRVLKPGGRLLNCSASDIVTSTPEDLPGQVLAKMQNALRGEKAWHDRPERLEALAKESGFVFERIVTFSNTYETTISRMIEQIESNAMLTLQMATLDQKRDVVEPTLAELRSLPDHDSPIQRTRSHKIAILQTIPSA